MANLKSKKKFGISLRHAEMVLSLMQENDTREPGYTWTAIQVLGALKGKWGRYEPTVRQMGCLCITLTSAITLTTNEVRVEQRCID